MDAVIVAKAARVVALERSSVPVRSRSASSFASLPRLATGREALVVHRSTPSRAPPAGALRPRRRLDVTLGQELPANLGPTGRTCPDDRRGETDSSPPVSQASRLATWSGHAATWPALRHASIMTLPRVLKPGTTYLVTRRCLERRFRLRPEQAVNDLLDYLVGYAALQSGVEVVAAVVLSNHYLCAAAHK